MAKNDVDHEFPVKEGEIYYYKSYGGGDFPTVTRYYKVLRSTRCFATVQMLANRWIKQGSHNSGYFIPSDELINEPIRGHIKHLTHDENAYCVIAIDGRYGRWLYKWDGKPGFYSYFGMSEGSYSFDELEDCDRVER